MALIWKWRPSHPSGSCLVLQAQRRCGKVAARSRARCCPSWVHPSSPNSWWGVLPQYSSLVERCVTMKIAAFMGNWWLAASSQQGAHSCITSQAEFFGETSNHPGDSAPHSPDLVLCDFWLLPKLKPPLKGKRFRPSMRFRKITMGQLLGKLWGPKVPTLKGTEASLSCVQCFLYLVSSIMSLSYYMAGYLLDRPSIFFIGGTLVKSPKPITGS